MWRCRAERTVESTPAGRPYGPRTGHVETPGRPGKAQRMPVGREALDL